MLNQLSLVLNEVVLGFLALAALGTGLAPLVFDVPPAVEEIFRAADWVIVALFAIEYAINFAAADDRPKSRSQRSC